MRKFIKNLITFRRCDACGKIDPPRYNGNDRLCGSEKCLTLGGFYRASGEDVGTNGKVGWWRLRFPIRIQWRGWWTL